MVHWSDNYAFFRWLALTFIFALVETFLIVVTVLCDSDIVIKLSSISLPSSCGVIKAKWMEAWCALLRCILIACFATIRGTTTSTSFILVLVGLHSIPLFLLLLPGLLLNSSLMAQHRYIAVHILVDVGDRGFHHHWPTLFKAVLSLFQRFLWWSESRLIWNRTFALVMILMLRIILLTLISTLFHNPLLLTDRTFRSYLIWRVLTGRRYLTLLMLGYKIFRWWQRHLVILILWIVVLLRLLLYSGIPATIVVLWRFSITSHMLVMHVTHALQLVLLEILLLAHRWPWVILPIGLVLWVLVLLLHELVMLIRVRVDRGVYWWPVRRRVRRMVTITSTVVGWVATNMHLIAVVRLRIQKLLLLLLWIILLLCLRLRLLNCHFSVERSGLRRRVLLIC